MCGGVLLLPELCLSKENNLKKTKTTSAKNLRKRERPQKEPDLTSKRIFPNTFGSEPRKMKQKHKQKTTKKHKTNTTTQKQKFAPEKFSKNDPKKRGTTKKRQKTPDQTPKNTKRKKRTAFPPSRRGKIAHKDPTMCDSTVAGLTMSPTPFLGRPLQHSAGKGWGGGGGETESVCHCEVTHGISVLTHSPKK